MARACVSSFHKYSSGRALFPSVEKDAQGPSPPQRRPNTRGALQLVGGCRRLQHDRQARPCRSSPAGSASRREAALEKKMAAGVIRPPRLRLARTNHQSIVSGRMKYGVREGVPPGQGSASGSSPTGPKPRTAFTSWRSPWISADRSSPPGAVTCGGLQGVLTVSQYSCGLAGIPTPEAGRSGVQPAPRLRHRRDSLADFATSILRRRGER